MNALNVPGSEAALPQVSALNFTDDEIAARQKLSRNNDAAAWAIMKDVTLSPEKKLEMLRNLEETKLPDAQAKAINLDDVVVNELTGNLSEKEAVKASIFFKLKEIETLLEKL
jgi:hypothetical protein